MTATVRERAGLRQALDRVAARDRRRASRPARLLCLTVAYLALADSGQVLVAQPMDGLDAAPPVSAAVGRASSPFPVEWTWSAVSRGPGRVGLEIVDLDGDGLNELVAASGPGFTDMKGYWFVLSWAGWRYEQTWSSPSLALELEELVVAQGDADPPLEVVALAGDRITVWDGASRAVQGTYTIPVVYGEDLAVGDVDADGAAEVVVTTRYDLYVFDLSTGTEEAFVAGKGGLDVALGQIDADPALEIGVADGNDPGWVLDGSTLLVDWSRAAGFGEWIRFGNLDGDPQDELVAAWRWGQGLRALDPESGAELFAVQPAHDLLSVAIANADTDPQVEVLYGDGQWGSLHVLDGATGAEEWSAPNPEWGVGAIAVGDADGDASPEVVWGVGSTPSLLLVSDGISHLVEWTSEELRGPFHGLAAGDLEGDGETELMAASFALADIGLDHGVVRAFDLRRRREVSLPGLTVPSGSWDLWRVATGRLDADPQDEVCQAIADYYRSGVACFDGLTGELQWQVWLHDNSTVVSLAIVDVDGDGRPEVLAGMAREGSPSEVPYVHCFAGETGWLEWRSPPLEGRELSLLEIGEVDGDPALEVIVADFGVRTWLLDGTNGLVEHGPFAVPATALAAGGPGGELLVGLADGSVHDLDPSSGATSPRLSGLGGVVTALAVAEVDGQPLPEIVAAAAGRAQVFDWATGVRGWQSDFLGDGTGDRDSLLVADLDRDGKKDLVIDIRIGFSAFLTGSAAQLPFADAFEAASLRRWSAFSPVAR